MRCNSRSSTLVSACGRLAYSASTSARNFSGPKLVNEDLDARLVLVVAASIEIVDAHDRLEIGDQFMLGQEVAHRHADHRRAAEAAADDHFPAALALVVE